jgi:hypothetical protein
MDHGKFSSSSVIVENYCFLYSCPNLLCYLYYFFFTTKVMHSLYMEEDLQLEISALNYQQIVRLHQAMLS